MKATELQKKIIDICINNLGWWRDNNDIDSPSNLTELNSDFSDLHIICGKHFHEVEATMCELWKAIRFSEDEKSD